MKKIIILIGPKGSGKSFIGILFQKVFQIKFIRVENWAKVVKKDRHIDNENYLKEVFHVIEKGVRESLKQNNAIVFESTGLTVYFDEMLRSLKKYYSLSTIKIIAEKDLCLKRIKTRDQSIHVNVSDKKVNIINDAVYKKNIETEFEIENNNAPKEELLEQISEIVKRLIPIK
jgi:shikimate kinase